MKSSSRTGLLAGVDIGGTKTAVVFGMEDRVEWRREFATEPSRGPQHALDQIVHLLHQGIEERSAPAAIGVSCGGPLDHKKGIILSPPNLPGWDAIEITGLLEREFNIPCRLENDANAGAMAEHRYGAGQGCKHILFLTMGTGLGAGLILNNEIFYGATAMAGEIGHVRLSASGPMGYGKQGSVEGWASGGGMAQHGAETVRRAISEGEHTSLATSLDTLTARDIGNAIQKGDAVAKRIVQQTGERLGDALAILVDVLNPERIIVGGLALRLGEDLLRPARERLREEALADSVAACTIVPAKLGASIGDIAALCVAAAL